MGFLFNDRIVVMANQTLTVWQQITVEFNGHSLTGSYAMENGIVKVKTPFGEKADPCMCSLAGRVFKVDQRRRLSASFASSFVETRFRRSCRGTIRGCSAYHSAENHVAAVRRPPKLCKPANRAKNCKRFIAKHLGRRWATGSRLPRELKALWRVGPCASFSTVNFARLTFSCGYRGWHDSKLLQ